MDSLPISAPERYPSRRGRPDLPAPRASPLHLGDHPAVDCRGSELQGQRRLHSDERRPLGRCQGPARGARILPTAVHSSAGACSLVLATDGLPPAPFHHARAFASGGSTCSHVVRARHRTHSHRADAAGRGSLAAALAVAGAAAADPKKRLIAGTQRMIPLAAVVPNVYECALATGGDPSGAPVA